MSSLLADFAAAVRRHPERVAIVDGRGVSTTFAQLAARADGFAACWAARGIGRGDRVLLAMRVDADLYAALAALWSLGATVVLPEPAMGLAGLRHAAGVTGARAFCTSGVYGLLRLVLPQVWGMTALRPPRDLGGDLGGDLGPAPDLPPPVAEDIALISFTSGTTGVPKAIPRSHGFLAAQQRAVAPLLHSDSAPRDLVAFPVFVLINIAEGRTSVLPDWKMSRPRRVRPQGLSDWITRQQVSRALIPPALCEVLAQARPAGLTTVFTGGGPVFPDTLARLTAAQPGLSVICVYGSTEAEPIAHLDAARITPDDHAAMLAGRGLLVGSPVPDLRVRIVADEIQVAGLHVNAGYLDPAQDAENKVHEGGLIWHRTGDAGGFDDTGRLWLWGRTGSQVMLTGGPAYPFSVEVAARRWPGVRQCALVTCRAGACLAIEGDSRHLPDWTACATALGIPVVRILDRIPMDRRHASKIDRRALEKRLA